MTDLERFRDYARAMAASTHRADCAVIKASAPGSATRFSFEEVVRPNPDCNGCQPEGERTLWQQMADEIDDYLTRDHDHDQPMLGEA